MPDFVRLQPTVLGLRNRIINHDAPAVWQIKRPQVKFFDRVEQEHGPLKNLKAATL